MLNGPDLCYSGFNRRGRMWLAFVLVIGFGEFALLRELGNSPSYGSSDY